MATAINDVRHAIEYVREVRKFDPSLGVAEAIEVAKLAIMVANAGEQEKRLDALATALEANLVLGQAQLRDNQVLAETIEGCLNELGEVISRSAK